jgi:hypothetical protein
VRSTDGEPVHSPSIRFWAVLVMAMPPCRRVELSTGR